MANSSRTRLSGGRLQSDFAPRRSGWRARAPWYAGLAVLAILVLAYIDGGEEPLRPITQTVEVPETGSE